MAKLTPFQQYMANLYHTGNANDGGARAPGGTIHALAPLAPLVGLIPGVGPAAAAALTAAGALSSAGGGGSQGRTNQNAGFAQANQQQLAGVGSDLLARYHNAAPQERQVLDYFMQRAGLGPGGNAQSGVGVGGAGGVFGQHLGTTMGTAPGVNGGQPFAAWGSRSNLPGFQAQTQGAGPLGGALGIYNSPEYQLLRQQAEQDIGHQVQNSQLGFNAELGQRGIDRSSIQQGGQAAITAGGNKSYADFVRQLAIGAADKQDQLAGQALNSLGGSLGSGQQAGQLFGQGAGLGYQGQGINQAQQNTNSSALGTAIGDAAHWYSLGTGGTPSAGNTIPRPPTDTSTIPGAPGTYGARFAHGGPVHAGQPVLVGDDGGAGPLPETFVPTGGKTEKVSIPAQVLQDLISHLIARSAVHTISYQPPAPSFQPPVPLPHRAAGGPVQPGQPYLVGEHGPEVMIPQQNGVIIPNPSTPAAAPTQHPLVSYLQALQQIKGRS